MRDIATDVLMGERGPVTIRNTDYLENQGRVCPFCNADLHQAGTHQFGFGSAERTVTCPDCSAVWSEVYKMERISIIRTPPPAGC